jgi:hypothetical protein
MALHMVTHIAGNYRVHAMPIWETIFTIWDPIWTTCLNHIGIHLANHIVVTEWTIAYLAIHLATHIAKYKVVSKWQTIWTAIWAIISAI